MYFHSCFTHIQMVYESQVYIKREGFIAIRNPNIFTLFYKNYATCINMPCTYVMTSNIKRGLTCITYRFAVNVEDVIHTISPCVEVDGSGSDFCLLAGFYSNGRYNYVLLQLQDVVNCVSFSYSPCRTPSLTLSQQPCLEPQNICGMLCIIKMLF